MVQNISLQRDPTQGGLTSDECMTFVNSVTMASQPSRVPSLNQAAAPAPILLKTKVSRRQWTREMLEDLEKVKY